MCFGFLSPPGSSRPQVEQQAKETAGCVCVFRQYTVYLFHLHNVKNGAQARPSVRSKHSCQLQRQESMTEEDLRSERFGPMIRRRLSPLHLTVTEAKRQSLQEKSRSFMALCFIPTSGREQDGINFKLTTLC